MISRRTNVWQRASVLLSSLLLAGVSLFAQSATATLNGTITDNTGAVIAGATVTITSLATGQVRTATSNEEGFYTFPLMRPDTYRLRVEKAGFSPAQQDNVLLQVGDTSVLNVSLKIGAVGDTVTITDSAPLLETGSSSLGEVVNKRTIESLPLNGRSTIQLVALSPGVTPSRNFRSMVFGSGNADNNTFAANGGRNGSNEIILDGSPQIVMGINQAAYIPNPDNTLEFKVQTNGLAAEYGRTGGAVINVVSRSGTNDFHGALFHFLRNDLFDANTFFNNRANRKKSPFRFNQFGGVMGGPASIPGLYAGKNKAFFFFGYEGIRQVTPTTALFTVPTARMRQGDFSEVTTALFDPATIDATGRRQRFTNNQIPTGRINPVAAKLLSFYPLPNQPGLVNNYITQAGGVVNTNDFNTRIDHRWSDAHTTFGRCSRLFFDSISPDVFGNAASPDAGRPNRPNHSVTIDHTWVKSQWVMHGNYGFVAHSNLREYQYDNVDLTSLGFPQAVAGAAQFKVFPRIDIGGFAPLGSITAFYNGNKFQAHNFNIDVTRVVGNHTFKTGFAHRINRVRAFRPDAPAGNFVFDERWTRETFNGTTGGNALASFMLGLMTSGRIQSEPELNIQVRYFGTFFQDDWKVNDRLTLNLGLRWDTDLPQTERDNKQAWFDFNAPVPLTVPGVTNLRGGLVYAGRNGAPRGLKDPDYNNFAPRIGLAYKISDRMVLRSSFGTFFNPATGTGPGTANSGALGFNAQTAVNASVDGFRTPATTLSNPFPNGFVAATNGNQGLLTLVGQTINAQVREDRTPYSMQWNFNLQYELPSQMLADIAYAGNAGVKLFANAQLNQLPDAELARGNALNTAITNPFFGILPANSPIGGRTITQGQLLRPYPHLTGLIHTNGTMAHSSYHALQFKFRKQFSSGLQFLTAYTWSKLIDDISSILFPINTGISNTNTGYTNNNRRILDKSISGLDQPHTLTMNFQYDLPFGKGRRFANTNTALDWIIGGWNVSGIMNLQSGLPISIDSAVNTTFSNGGVQRPNKIGDSATAGEVVDRLNGYINRASFVDAPRFTFGTTGRYLPDLRAPGYYNWDISILRNFKFTERVSLQFRTEMFNAFNHANFSAPVGTTFGRADFGVINATERARVIQFGLKLLY